MNTGVRLSAKLYRQETGRLIREFLHIPNNAKSGNRPKIGLSLILKEGSAPGTNEIQGKMMNADVKAQWHDEGAKMIIDYCTMLAGMIGITLKSVYWSEKPALTLGKHILTIVAENGEIKLLFALEDIATFSGKVGTERTQKKLKKALFGFRT